MKRVKWEQLAEKVEKMPITLSEIGILITLSNRYNFKAIEIKNGKINQKNWLHEP